MCVESVTKASIKKDCMQKLETSILKNPKQQLLKSNFILHNLVFFLKRKANLRYFCIKTLII